MKRRVVRKSFGWVSRQMATNYMFRIFLLTMLSLWVSSAIAGDAMTRVGYAYDSNTNQLLYTESHHEKYSGGVLQRSEVIYKDPAEKIFASKIADFSNSLFMPEFALENIRTGHEEKTRFIDNKYEVFFSESKNKTREESQIIYEDNAISDAGFDNFIIEHWAQIIEGKKFKRDFLVPSMQDFLSFRIYQDAIVNREGQSLRLINIEPDSFFVRVIAGTLKLYYDSEKPALRIFEGVSNMRDSKGDNYNVLIKYVDVKSQILSVNE